MRAFTLGLEGSMGTVGAYRLLLSRVTCGELLMPLHVGVIIWGNFWRQNLSAKGLEHLRFPLGGRTSSAQKAEDTGVSRSPPHLRLCLLDRLVSSLLAVLFGESPVHSLLAIDLATAIQVQKLMVLVKNLSKWLSRKHVKIPALPQLLEKLGMSTQAFGGSQPLTASACRSLPPSDWHLPLTHA